MLDFDSAVVVINRDNFEQVAVRAAVPTTYFRRFYPIVLSLAPSLVREPVMSLVAVLLLGHQDIYTPFSQ